MSNEQTGSVQSTDHASQWLTTIASLLVGAGFFALWFWLLPPWLGFRADIARAPQWRWLAAVPSVLGFAVAIRCIWDFGHSGRGTPMPLAPPQRLVIVGFYRYVRNPMYVGFFVGWIGIWVVFGRANMSAIAWATAVVLSVNFLCACTHSTKNVRRGLRRILLPCRSLVATYSRMAEVSLALSSDYSAFGSDPNRSTCPSGSSIFISYAQG